MGKVRRVPECGCPRSSLPDGLSWADAKSKGWKKVATKAGESYLCPDCAAKADKLGRRADSDEARRRRQSQKELQQRLSKRKEDGDSK
jgi:hypothetical protein